MESNKISLISLIVALMLCFICYYPALFAPFYIDDFGSIVNNQKLFQLNLMELFQVYGMRFVGYLSFALNGNLFEQLEPSHFRVVNLIIHFLVSTFVFFVIRKLIRINKHLSNTGNQQLILFYLPFVLSILYLIHPLNTQAVTYVVQRLASLVALFYISSFYFYLLARTAISKKSIVFYTLLSVIMFVFAMFTKQNAVTLPLIIILSEFIFFRQGNVLKLSKIFKIVIVITSVLFLLFFLKDQIIQLLISIDNFTRETQLISRSDYAATQTLMLWDYICKFFIPVGLQLNYSNQLLGTFTEPKIIIALVGHVTMILIAFKLRSKSPLAAFGILFYYVAHLVESSIIPITDLGFEHRAYLPNIGFIIAIAGFIMMLAESFTLKAIKYALAFLTFVIVIFSITTINRNSLWSDKLAFSKNEILVSPQSVRALTMLAAEYLNRDERGNALQYYQEAINLSVANKTVSFDLLRDYIKTLYSLGQYESAGPLTTLVMKYTNAHKRKDRSELLALIAVSHREAGRLGFAKGLLLQATKLDPDNGYAHHQLATVLWNMGQREEAMGILRRFQIKHSDDPKISSLLDQMLTIEN
ncbi:tetratricopeptide repeat protein [Shewanella aestuarii]|uniref:Tetratricopeptide repeat protein n=1 Tax=Shewanella aestuarii TaxID=1028752 RepID=A0A6G9QL72_9GAMM|nr:tetratricopeptide repeat protein [Shewanella aestuarii]QIR15138.1 tetratricopeptide repeat protein [Shewanella aestuarii]